MVEITFAFLKPDATHDPLVMANVLHMLSDDGDLTIVAVGEPKWLTEQDVHGHYSEYCKPGEVAGFIPDAVEYLTDGFVLPLLIKGENAIARVRQIVGATRPWEAEEGTIRALYGEKTPSPNGNICNSIHASDSAQAVDVEAQRFFSANNLARILGH